MTDGQREFWRALTAPFPGDSYETRPGQGGRTYTYLKSRTIMNRLDDVCGPDGWTVEFTEGQRGIICDISIQTPGADSERCRLVRRSWGGAYKADMQTEDAAFKTGFSNAFKVCASCFGIGRELYGEGMPDYCADLHNTNASGTPQSGPGAGAPPRQAENPGGNRASYSSGNGQTFENQPPFGKGGTKAPYAWAKKCGEHFQVDVLGHMIDYAKRRKKTERTDQWDDGFLDECLAEAVSWLRLRDNYNGEFGDVPAAGEPQQQNQSPAQRQNSGPQEMVNLKQSIAASITALLHRQVGRAPSQGEVIATIEELGASVANGAGHRGEVLVSLRNCEDKRWLTNILQAANKQIQEAASQAAQDAAADDDDIPF